MIPFRKIVANFFQTILRFPAPILSALLAFGFMLVDLHLVEHSSYYSKNFIFVKSGLACMSGISLFIAFDIFSETKQVAFSKRLGLILLGFCIIGLHYYSITPGMFSSDGIFISRYLLFLVCFHLLISFIAFYHVHEIRSFWEYNYFLFRRFFISVAYSFTLFLGLASALWAIGKLFGFDFQEEYYLDIAGFIFLVFNTVYFLSDLPTDWSSFSEQKEFKQGTRIFVQYILLPIVGVYAIILYIYMFKILITNQLPIGWVCIPILVFAIIGILAFLLIYPIRGNKNNKLVYLFSTYFFYLLLPLLSLYFISIYLRIMPYGVTEDRYLIVILGIWLAIISLYHIVSSKDNIIIIPSSLFLLLALSAIGPWGMFQLGVQNQLVRLERILKRNHLLNNDKLIDIKFSTKIEKLQVENIQSILTYLNRRGEIGRIRHWLKDSDQIALDRAMKEKEPYSIQAIFNSVQIEDWDDVVTNYTISNKSNMEMNHSISMDGYSQLALFQAFSSDKVEGIDTSLQINSFIVNQELVVLRKFDTILTLNLRDHAKMFYQMQKRNRLNESSTSMDSFSSLNMVENQTMGIALPADSMRIMVNGKKLEIHYLNLSKKDTAYVVDELKAYLMY